MQAVEVQRLSCVAWLGHCCGSKLSRPRRIFLSPELGHDSFRLRAAFLLQANAITININQKSGVLVAIWSHGHESRGRTWTCLNASSYSLSAYLSTSLCFCVTHCMCKSRCYLWWMYNSQKPAWISSRESGLALTYVTIYFAKHVTHNKGKARVHRTTNED